jgi:hypothetical protein
MSETLSASNQQASPSDMRPPWSNPTTRRNTGSVHPVQPVQPFLESYKINKKAHLPCESGSDFLAQKTFLRKYHGQVGRAEYALFFSTLQELYLGHRVDAPWTELTPKFNKGAVHHA